MEILRDYKLGEQVTLDVQKLCFPLFSVMTANKGQSKIDFFTEKCVTLENGWVNTNLFVEGEIPHPNQFDLAGISYHVIEGSVNDKKKLRASNVGFQISGRIFLEVPGIALEHKNIDAIKLSEIYKKFKHYLEEMRENKKDPDFNNKIEIIQASDIDQELFVYFPVCVGLTAIRIYSKQPFRVKMTLEEPLGKECKVVMILHGFMYRPAV